MSDEIKSLKARISDLEKAISKLELENKQYKTGYEKLLAENNELKFNKNHQTNNQLKSILFKFDNVMEFSAIAIDIYKLMDVYSIALEQMDTKEYSSVTNLKFHYNGQDITNNFLNNNRVGSLNLSISSIITVNKLKLK